MPSCSSRSPPYVEGNHHAATNSRARGGNNVNADRKSGQVRDEGAQDGAGDGTQERTRRALVVRGVLWWVCCLFVLVWGCSLGPLHDHVCAIHLLLVCVPMRVFVTRACTTHSCALCSCNGSCSLAPYTVELEIDRHRPPSGKSGNNGTGERAAAGAGDVPVHVAAVVHVAGTDSMPAAALSVACASVSVPVRECGRACVRAGGVKCGCGCRYAMINARLERPVSATGTYKYIGHHMISGTCACTCVMRSCVCFAVLLCVVVSSTSSVCSNVASALVPTCAVFVTYSSSDVRTVMYSRWDAAPTITRRQEER